MIREKGEDGNKSNKRTLPKMKEKKKKIDFKKIAIKNYWQNSISMVIQRSLEERNKIPVNRSPKYVLEQY